MKSNCMIITPSTLYCITHNFTPIDEIHKIKAYGQSEHPLALGLFLIERLPQFPAEVITSDSTSKGRI